MHSQWISLSRLDSSHRIIQGWKFSKVLKTFLTSRLTRPFSLELTHSPCAPQSQLFMHLFAQKKSRIELISRSLYRSQAFNTIANIPNLSCLSKGMAKPLAIPGQRPSSRLKTSAIDLRKRAPIAWSFQTESQFSEFRDNYDDKRWLGWWEPRIWVPLEETLTVKDVWMRSWVDERMRGWRFRKSFLSIIYCIHLS